MVLAYFEGLCQRRLLTDSELSMCDQSTALFPRRSVDGRVRRGGPAVRLSGSEAMDDKIMQQIKVTWSHSRARNRVDLGFKLYLQKRDALENIVDHLMHRQTKTAWNQEGVGYLDTPENGCG